MFIQSCLTIMRPETPQEEECKVDKEEKVYTGEQRAIVYAWVCAVVAIALPFVFYSVVLLKNNKCSRVRYTSIGDFMKKYLPKNVKDKYCDENEDKQEPKRVEDIENGITVPVKTYEEEVEERVYNLIVVYRVKRRNESTFRSVDMPKVIEQLS